MSVCFYASVYFCVSVCICTYPQKLGHVRAPAPLSLILSSLSTGGVGGISLAGRGRPGTCRREIPETRLPQIHEIQSHAGNFPAVQPPRSRSPTFQTCAALPKQTHMYTIISQHDWSVEEAGGSFPQKIPASRKRFRLTWSLTS